MSENKYVRMMRQAEDECRIMAVSNAKWPEIAADNLIEAADWQSAADALEALLQVCEWQLVPPHPVGSNAEYRRLSEEWAKAALKKAKGEV